MHHIQKAIFLPLLAAFLCVPAMYAQAPAGRGNPDAGWVWIEQLSGSVNSFGPILATTSSGGYNFNSHLGVIAGLPFYSVHNSTAATSSSVNGIGDLFGGVRLVFALPLISYRMSLIGTAPTGDTAKGLGIGQTGYDWTHHVDVSIGRLTPFANAGLTNSPYQSLLVQRQFVSAGHAAHFELGSTVHVIGPLSASGSFYDIEPWGPQTLLSQVVTAGGPAAGGPGHGQAFASGHQTVGTSTVTRDRGLNAGANVRVAPAIELWTAYNHSNSFALNTISFGITVDMLGVIHRARE